MRFAPLILLATLGAGTCLGHFEERTSGKEYLVVQPAFRASIAPFELTLRDKTATVRLRFGPGTGDGKLDAEDRVSGWTNYLTAERRQLHVATYSKLRQKNIFPGIDAVYYWRGSVFEYDLLVHPGADPAAIVLFASGAETLRLTQSGDLALATKTGEFVWKRPSLFQTAADGQSRQISGKYVLLGNSRIGFRTGDYDPKRVLTIDPSLTYSTYLGGAGNEGIRSIVTDNAGNVYVAGATTSQNLSVTRPVQSAYGGHTSMLLAGDAFVAKFTASGTLVYLTYLGGSADDFATGLALDPAGNLWIAGGTSSSNFPVTANAYQRTNAGSGGSDLFKIGDAFLARLSPDGDTIQYATYYGGRADECFSAIAVDSSGNVHLTGATSSPNLPITAGAYSNVFLGAGGEQVYPRYGVVPFNAGDAFYAKFNPAGTALLYATYFGGGLDDAATSIAVDGAGAAYLAGYTLSSSFPVTAGAYQRNFRGSDLNNNIFWNFGDAWVAKFNATGGLVYSTLLGGTCDDVIGSIQVDAAGNAWVAGSTCSQNFPTSANAYQTNMRGPYAAPIADQLIGDGFVTGLNPAGTALVYSTFLGGSGDDSINAMALDGAGNLLLTGLTNSSNFPLSADAQQTRFAGGGIMNQNQDFGDLFLAQLDPKTSTLKYSTYLGGTFDDVGAAIAFDTNGNVYVGGNTVSGNYPVTAGALQAQLRGTGSAGRYRGDAVFSRFGGFSTSAVPTFAAVQNAASYAAGAVAPGLIIVGYGSSIGPAQLAGAALDSTGKLAGTVADTQFLFDGVAAPIIYVSATQSSMVVPYEVAGKASTQIVAVYKGQRSAPLTVPVVASQPGLFSANFSGTGQGAIYNQDARPNGAAAPARRGDIVILYGTGEGQTSPAGITGAIANSVYPKPLGEVSVTIGGVNAEVLYAGAVPGVVGGEFQINVRVPLNLSAGNLPVIVRIGNAQSQAGLTAAIN